MSYQSKVEQIYANELLLTSKTGTNVNIRCSTGEVLINGSDPSGGGASLPLIGTGNIEIVGDISAEGNITATATGPNQGLLTATRANISSDVTITGNGNLRLNGTGTIELANSVSCGGIISSDDINTTANNDFVSGRDIYFEGQDLYHRSVTGFPPQVVNTPYTTFRQLPQLNAANTFTGANKFNSNVTEFADKVSVGERDGGGLFTQTIALNKSGNIECQTIQNVTSIQTGTLNCGNGAINSCAAKYFTTRTSGLAGWKMEQEVASVPAGSYDNVLNFRAGQVGGFVTITDSVEGPGVPNIILDPKTKALGGLIKTTTFEVGDGGLAYKLTQPVSGTDSDNLLIKSNSAVSEVIFQDETSAGIMTVKKTEVQLGNTIPLSFGLLSFRPQQFYKDITNFSFNHSLIGPTNLLFNTGNPIPTDWTNVNTAQTGQSIDLVNNAGAYKITIRQTSIGSQGEINGMHVMSDMVLSIPNDNLPEIELAQPTAYSYTTYDGNSPIITMKPGFLNWAVHCTFPQISNNETANIRITLTQMPYFA